MAEATLPEPIQGCPRCRRMLGRDHYPPSSWGTKGYYCRECAAAYQREYKLRNQGGEPRELPRHAVCIRVDALRVVHADGRRRKLYQPPRPRRIPSSTDPDRLAYTKWHAKLGVLLGSASKRDCVECGEPAAEWAYDHQDQNELEGLTRRGRLCSYSENPSHYQPMCRSCHSRHDRAHWFATRLAPVLDAHGIDAAVRDTVLKEVRSFR